jgi:hypothetical protein
MAKKQKLLRLNKIRASMLKNCNEWLSRFDRIQVNLSVGAAATSAYQKQTSQITDNSQSQQWEIQKTSTHESDVIILIQTALVQEWNIFLDSVFCDTVLYLLETGNVEKLPSERLDLKKIVPTGFSHLRKSIANAASESFSFKPYDQKIDILCKIFNTNDELPQKSFLKKHVEIRNIFQHNRGIVRQTDLDKMGEANFVISQEDQTKKTYSVGEMIILTLCEIQKLNNAIKDFSIKFEVLQ